ncbi:MAG: alpha/beta fold hydrolase [Bacteroidetes bacterium]|nr:MAG: alpha/beta fold hydrolase [Bacteroidota bacterium]
MSYLLYTALVLLGLYSLLCVGVYIYQERLIFFPQTLPTDYRFKFREPHQEIYVENAGEENRLHALWFKKPDKKADRVVLYFHGNAGSLAGWGGIAQDFVPLGYDVFIIDYRGYGKSRGEMSQKTLLADVQKAYDFVCQYYAKDKITVFGRSLGSGLACYVASVGKAERLILETPYYNFSSLVSYHVPFLPAFLLLRYNFRSDQYLHRVTCPVYMFHGTNDATIPDAQGRKLALAYPQAHFISIEGGTHNDLSDFPLYQQKLEEILTK